MLAFLDLPDLQVTPDLLVLRVNQEHQVDQELLVRQVRVEWPDLKDLRDLKASMEYRVALEQLEQLDQSVPLVLVEFLVLLEILDKQESRVRLVSLE